MIDLRGNGGGSSAYANRLAALLWSEELVDAHRPELGPVAWRASPAVLAQVLALRHRMEANPTEAANLAGNREIAQGIERAMAAGEPLFVQRSFGRRELGDLRRATRCAPASFF